MSHLYFDEQIFIMQRAGGGIPRYFVELIRAIPSVDSEFQFQPSPAFRFCRNETLIADGWAVGVPPMFSHPKPLYALNWWHRRRLSKPSIVHHTYYHSRFLDYPRHLHRVTTVHDMIPEALPHLFRTNPHLEKREFVRRSNLILCVSNHTRERLLEYYPETTAPIRVTPLGVSPWWFEEGSPAIMAADRQIAPYMLFVGSRASYKEFPTLLRAMSLLPDREIGLTVVGGSAPTTGEAQLIEELGLTGRVSFRGASDEELRELYRGAVAFIYPSLHEGFGLPILEAFAAGTRVILAAASVFPEVGGDAAEYFEPANPESLAHVMDSVACEPQLQRQTRIAAGMDRASTYSWSNTARLTAAAYELLR